MLDWMIFRVPHVLFFLTLHQFLHVPLNPITESFCYPPRRQVVLVVVVVVVVVGMIRGVTMSIFRLHRPWSSLWPCMKPTALTTSGS
jgi:hypothetical protein